MRVSEGRVTAERQRKRGKNERETERERGRKLLERGAGCEEEGSVTAANQISWSPGRLMSGLLCDRLLTALSGMKECKSTSSMAPLHAPD